MTDNLKIDMTIEIAPAVAREVLKSLADSVVETRGRLGTTDVAKAAGVIDLMRAVIATELACVDSKAYSIAD